MFDSTLLRCSLEIVDLEIMEKEIGNESKSNYCRTTFSLVTVLFIQETTFIRISRVGTLLSVLI